MPESRPKPPPFTPHPEERISSPEFEELLERAPSRLMRWGTLSVMLFFALLFGLATMIDYPDTLEGRAFVTTDPLPIKIKAPIGGRILQVMVKENQAVKAGQLLGEIENTSGLENIVILDSLCSQINQALHQHDFSKLNRLNQQELYSLGEAQDLYNQLQEAVNAYLSLSNQHIYDKRITNLTKRPSRHETIVSNVVRNKDLLREDIESQVRNLQNYTQAWKLKYLLAAPYSGRVHELRSLQANEVLQAGEALYIITPDTCTYIASSLLPSSSLGKIEKGQTAHILLDQFPYNEFGHVEGKVSFISSTPQAVLQNNNQVNTSPVYRVYIQLGDSLRTSHHKKISFTPEMSGTARIITKDKNLLQRLIEHVRKTNK